MSTNNNTSSHKDGRADLRKMMAQQPLPSIPPGIIDPASMTNDQATEQVCLVLKRLNSALATGDAKTLESCFFASQAYWRDQLALTYHLRTFTTPNVITAALLETKGLRGITGENAFSVAGTAQFIPAAPTLQFIDCGLIFRTGSPAATCSGRLLLLPIKGRPENGNGIEWKIWILSTMLDSLDLQQEDKGLLQSPARPLGGLGKFETDVFIIGGGNAAIALAARLKTLGVESVMVEKNAQTGDNWALRYECMRFHIPTSFCELPYMNYDKELHSPHLLTRDELASQVQRYVAAFNLNVLTSAQIQSTTYDSLAKHWKIKFQTPAGICTAVSKQLVQATGIGSQKHNIPSIPDRRLYNGISVHSAQYKSAKQLREKGVQSVLVIGSANTAFDIIEDCHSTGLQTTMVVRSPTYLIPMEYISNKNGLGAYDDGVEVADKLFLTLPTVIDSQLARNMFAQLAAEEPSRYASLSEAGFPVIDSAHPDAVLSHNLLERAGGHYVDVGGTKVLEEGQVGVKAGVEPIAYTETGLRFSDNTSLDADAIVWCTGFADKDVRTTAAEILGGSNSYSNDNDNGNSHLLGPNEIANRLESTWGVDSEGEICGMWKRHSNLDNFWVMGGFTQQHRWHSRTLALQIKAALEGVLPPAYRETPTIKNQLSSLL